MLNSFNNNSDSNLASNKSNLTSNLKSKPEKSKYDLLRKLLVVVIFLVGIYFLTSPFLPAIALYMSGSSPSIPYETKIEKEIWDQAKIQQPSSGSTEKKPIPQDRRVVIPSIKVDMPIIEAADESGLSYGVWRRPNGGTLNSGNMILTGHRLGYGFLPNEIMKQSSFYNLDKLNDGDYIIIYWDGTEYDYVVRGGETVLPTETRIEDPTPEHKLTLYTCTPVGINDHRLVKYAYPIAKTADASGSNSSNSSDTSKDSSSTSSADQTN